MDRAKEKRPAGRIRKECEKHRMECIEKKGKILYNTGKQIHGKEGQRMKQQAFNPYLPSWEYIPDGEPHVYGDRVYVYGSHDRYNGDVFCLGDYMGYSAPVDDLSDWRCEGVIYPKTADPMNRDGRMNLFAPDVTQGPDGRFYLYYVLDGVGVVSVAAADSPAGPFAFYGYVHDAQGNRLGDRPGDEPQFDPGVLTEGKRTYLYTGFCGHTDKSRHGAMATVLDEDMLTIVEEPRFIAPGSMYAAGTSFEAHPFFEASSIRKHGQDYVFVYSSAAMHELCYAVSKRPTEGFVFGGVIVSNCDIGIGTYKPADMPCVPGGNNHGGLVEIRGQWYIFYHRQTNGTWYCRQGCAEPVHWTADGQLPQVEITSCGLNGGPLKGEGEYPTYIACHLFSPEKLLYAGKPGQPRIMQDGRDGDEEPGYIGSLVEGTVIGFKYFDCRGVRRMAVRTRGYVHGSFQVMNRWDGPVLGEIPVKSSNVWTESQADVALPDGVQSVYLRFCGGGASNQGPAGAIASIRFICD